MNRTAQPLHKIRIHAYLRRPDAQGFYSVRLISYFHNTSFCVSPGVKILPERVDKGKKPEVLWSADTLRVTSRHPDADIINHRLQHWQQRIEEAFNKLSGPGGMTLVTQLMMEEELFPKQEKKSTAAEKRQLTFPAFYDVWYAENQGILRESYTRKFRSVANLLDSFRPGTTIGDISEEFVRDYRRFLLKKGSSDATIAQEYKFLRIAAERAGIPSTMPWLRYSEQSAPQLDLYKEELQRLIRTPMPTPALELERDRWLLQCFAGRRDADMASLNVRQLEHMETAEGLIPCLRHAQKKNTQLAMAPLPPVAVRIGEKWNWQLPKGHNQTRNKLIKQVAEAAGLTRVFNLMKISGQVATDNYRPVHEIISTHTSRHTCASLLLEGTDGDKSLANFVLGHANRDITDRYAKDKVRRIAPKVLAAWRTVLGDCYDQTPA